MKSVRKHYKIILGVPLLVFVAVLFISNKSYVNSPRSESSADLISTTNELAAMLPEYPSLTSDIQATLHATAQKRSTLLLSLLNSNPKEFLNQARFSDVYSSFPTQVQNDFNGLIEQPVSLSGSVSRIIAETDSEDTAEHLIFMSNTEDKMYQLTYADPHSSIESGEARISGVVLGNHLVASENQLVPTDVLASTVTSGSLRTLVMVFEFANSDPSERNFTIDELKSRLVTAPDSVKNAIEKDSYYVAGTRGATLLSNPDTDFYGWFKIANNKPATTSDCNVASYATSADSKAKQLYPDISTKISKYERIIYVWPRQENCYSPLVEGPWNGWAEIPGRRSWINGMIASRTLVHELGHNFGLEHAVTITCPKPISDRSIDYFNLCRLPIDLGTGIANYEYGDRYDIMGSGGKFNADGSISYNTAAHTNARYKMKLGWLSSSRQKSVSSSNNNLTLLPLENYASTGYQVLRIPRPKATESETFTSDYYYVEYRVAQPGDTDNIWPINTLSPGGVVIRMYGNNKYLRSATNSTSASVLVDAIAPYDGNFADAALYNPGNPATDTFYDPINKIRIKLVSASTTSAKICVDINDKGTCGTVSVTGTPSPTPTLTATPTVTPVSQSPVPTNPPGGSQQTVKFLPDSDSYVDQANLTRNYGTNATLSVNGGSNPARETFIRFQVSGVGSVQNAKLRVYDTDNGSKDGPMVYAASNSWTEGGITFNTKPERISGVLGDVGVVDAGTWVEYNVTSAVTGNGSFTFNLAPGGSDGLTFSSRQGAQPPELVVDYQ